MVPKPEDAERDLPFTEQLLSTSTTFDVFLRTTTLNEPVRLRKHPRQEYPTGEGPQALFNENEIGSLATPVWGRRSLGLERTATGIDLWLEFIPGVTLSQWTNAQERTLKERLLVSIATCKALEAMHATGLVHQNITGTNLIVDESGRVVRLINYTLSAQIRRGTLLHTDPTSPLGSLVYVAPERTSRIGRGYDHRADLYSLGTTLYELFVGHAPFPNLDPLALVHAQIARLPTPPSRIRANLPPQLDKIILKLLAKDPDDRYQSAEGARHDFARCFTYVERGVPIEPFAVGLGDTVDRLIIP